ncbi:MAG: restriction endonuclease [Candidatus Heimdallarchaeota archaeon]|nr:restriction endonuclease [Candidatus Heimdallarchaeota archaeon]
MKRNLTISLLKEESRKFSDQISNQNTPDLFGITDGKAIGTYVEHQFFDYLKKKYLFEEGSSARGIDFPGLNVDIKVTRVTQPQSSCPYKNARQKVYGLGNSILLFVYEKQDDLEHETCRLNIVHNIFIDKERTADYQMTSLILQTLENNGNIDDLIAIFEDRNLPVDAIGAKNLAEELMKNKPSQGYLTISNALQWRLQYSRVIKLSQKISGIDKLR